MRNKKLIPMVIGNDGETPDNYEMARIREARCLNCNEPFDETRPGIYAVTRQGIIFWHKENCTHKNR